ncbi:PD-(D/E)XK nuclease family protein [Brumimicrobium oceani]|uniref:Uncharacterized protein n=1 Tax=Brumimicrobium oceani TaxID=2100725 RepID=A0A2U2XBW3_9FLAO|nr:PD-(D/E)XK nuclease family protein [Brumimicrobium oceani]PWH85240.1 hypothetical protein DIT68_09890 [Brumimicrobium oceani]
MNYEINNVSSLPSFFNYKEEDTDNGYETTQDFFLSWTLRCSQEKYKDTNPIVYNYSRKILYALIIGENDNQNIYNVKSEVNESFVVLEVKTYRQWKQIDLLVEIKIRNNNKEEKYVLNIENKWYTNIRTGQLEKSKQAVEEVYNSEFKIVNLLIFCDDEKINESIKNQCTDINYKALSIIDLKRLSNIDNNEISNNYLFDEYWFRF